LDGRLDSLGDAVIIAAGTKLGSYEVLSSLGSGGMGEVYRARDERLGRDIALKILRPEFASDRDRLWRFRREAQVLAALDHPGIVTIFTVEEINGVNFLTMQLVEGETLERIIADSVLAARRLFEIAIPLTDAVAAAHRQGVVHRDLKPSNVMCTRDGAVKVLDFGLAKPVPGQASTTRTLSEEGQIIGTVPYMSPEQLSGRPLDTRTDVFSLGVMLYEMAAGARPFDGATPVAMLTAILTQVPRPVREVRPDLPEGLSSLIERCLRREITDRLSSVRELNASLRRLWQSGPSQREWSARTGTEAVVTAGASIAVLPFASLSADPEDAFFADGTSEEIINALGRLPDLKVAARTSSFSFKGKNEDLRVIGEKLGVKTVLEGSVRRSGKRLRISAQLVDASNGFHLWSERYDRELVDVFEIQEEIARSIASRLTATLISGSDDSLVRPGTSDVEAFRLYAEGRRLFDQRTGSGMQRAVPCFQAAIERDMNYAVAWTGLADTFLLLEDYQIVKPGTLLEPADEAVQRALTLDPHLAEAHASLGLLEIILRKGTAAIDALQRAVSLRPSYAEAHNWLSWVNLILGNRLDALTSAERATELNPLSPESLSNLAWSQIAAGQVERGLRSARRGLEIQPDFDSNAFLESLALYHLGRPQEALPILTKIAVSWSPTARISLLALCEAARGHASEARAHLEGLHAAGDLPSIGLVHAALGEVEHAFGAFERETRWGYWGAIAIHNFFEPVLRELRADHRFPAILRTVRQSWGVSEP
jgi:serine/threonine protein kinase/tetratricopeptide (TPR) repeat protein